MRIATYAAPLSRDGPGLLLRELRRGDDVQLLAILNVINHIQPDILVLTDVDYDANGAALEALTLQMDVPFEHWFARPPNTGVQVGIDLDGDGRRGDPQDALGFGRFRGDGGLAIFSHYPVLTQEVVDYSALIWAEMPGATLPCTTAGLFPNAAVFEQLPVSSKGHWVVPVETPGALVTLLVYGATPPVFDGPEDFNGLRNRDELRLWDLVLNGAFGPRPQNPVLVGNTNLDPEDGVGHRVAMTTFLARPDLQDPLPRSDGARLAADPGQQGDPALDTVDWPSDGPGNLRVSYILPSADLTVVEAGVFWPDPDAPEAAILGADGMAAGPHRLVWVDLLLPE